MQWFFFVKLIPVTLLDTPKKFSTFTCHPLIIKFLSPSITLQGLRTSPTESILPLQVQWKRRLKVPSRYKNSLNWRLGLQHEIKILSLVQVGKAICVMFHYVRRIAIHSKVIARDQANVDVSSVSMVKIANVASHYLAVKMVAVRTHLNATVRKAGREFFARSVSNEKKNSI
jgi:hypothetical protein